MENNRRWEKINDKIYNLFINDEKIGEMTIDFKTLDTIFKTSTAEFKTQRSGFWKSNIEVYDKDGKTIAKTSTDKWYSHFSTLKYFEKKFRFEVRNNPMVEFAILDENETVLAYALSLENKQICINITSSVNNNDPVLDYLIWQSFHHIANENFGRNYIFTTKNS